MNPVLKNILAVLAGLFIGGAVNMLLIQISGSIIPPPEGADLTTEEGLKASMALMQPKHFAMPFIAHALGTLVGAFVAVKIAASRHFGLAMVIAAFNLLGGAMMVAMLPSPMWFNILDLGVAYFPMAFIGYKLAKK